MVYPWGTKRRINTTSNYYKKTFGTRIQKVSLHAGFTCPNRDGTISTGGCSYCNNLAFNPSYCDPEKPISQQIREGIEFHETRYRSAARYFAYFQPFSNTYASPDRLAKIYNEALSNKKIEGLIIGTRPDCIDREKLELLSKLSSDHYIVVEYGIESVYDKTLHSINRGHTFQQAADAIILTHTYQVKAGAHLIFGLPGESYEDMMHSATVISALPLHTIKFHQLQIIRDTPFADQYNENPGHFKLFAQEEYIDFIATYLSNLNPAIIVDRVAGETQPRYIVNEMWGPRYDRILQKIEQHLEELDLWQGKNYKPDTVMGIYGSDTNRITDNNM